MPTYTFAGRYSEVFIDRFGNALASMPVTVYLADGTTPASIYSDRAKTGASNPTATDARGNLTFFADPGAYVLVATFNGVTQTPVEVSVDVDPEELAVAAADLALLNAEVDTKITGVGTSKVYTQATAPVSPADGDLWYDTGGVVELPNLDDLGDVNATAPTDGHVLSYNAATSTWVPVAQASGGGGGGGTPASTVTSETTFGIASAVGTGTDYARNDHTHGSPTNPVTAHEAAGDPHAQYLTAAEGSAAYEPAGTTATHAGAVDPHAGYRLESVQIATADVADGAITAAKVAADVATQAELDSATSAAVPKALVDLKGDLLAASAPDTVARLPVGTDGQVLTADAAEALGVKWAAASGGGGGGLTEIARATLAAPAATIDLSSIPATYRSLRLVMQVRGTQATALQTIRAQFNGDTTASYDSERLAASSNSAVSGVQAIGVTYAEVALNVAASAPAGSAGTADMVIPQYAGITFRKSFTATWSAPNSDVSAGQYVGVNAGEWRNTAAINQIVLFLEAGNFDTGTTLTLYGIGAA